MRRIDCNLLGHEGEWIERKEKITVGEWNEWKRADHEETLLMLDRLVTEWSLKNIHGDLVAETPFSRALDSLEVIFIPWIVQVITNSVFEDMTLPPNLFSPSSAAPKGKATDSPS